MLSVEEYQYVIANVEKWCDDLCKKYQASEPDIHLARYIESFKGNQSGRDIYLNIAELKDIFDVKRTFYHEFWHYKRKQDYQHIYDFYENKSWFNNITTGLDFLYYWYSLHEIDARAFGDSLGVLDDSRYLDLFQRLDIESLAEDMAVHQVYRHTLVVPHQYCYRELLKIEAHYKTLP